MVVLSSINPLNGGMGNEDAASIQKEQRSSGPRPFVMLIVLVIVSVVFGLTFNHFNPKGIQLSNSQDEDLRQTPDMEKSDMGPLPTVATYAHEGPVSESGFPIVNWNQVQELAQDYNALLVDARPDWSFKAGHVPGAVNLPFSFPTTPAYAEFVRAHSKERHLVIYCGDPACERSGYLAEKLRDEFKYTRLWLYEGGYEDYQEQTGQ